MIRRPPRSTLDRSSAASDVYKRQHYGVVPLPPPDSIPVYELNAATASAIEAIGRLDAIAVSYTHLRAHETVLDIVCRLLLEKKTKHTTKKKKKMKKKNKKT